MGSASRHRVSASRCDRVDKHPRDLIEETVDVGASNLTYDAEANQYVYVWKTEQAWLGKSYQLQVKLKDGTLHVANFSFR